jgi:hypothetical protein
VQQRSGGGDRVVIVGHLSPPVVAGWHEHGIPCRTAVRRLCCGGHPARPGSGGSR